MSRVVCFPKRVIKSMTENYVIARAASFAMPFAGKYSLEELVKEAESRSGDIGKAFDSHIKKYSSKTENVEIQTAISCAEVLFGRDADCNVCFVMNGGDHRQTKFTYEDVAKRMGGDPGIDCILAHEDKSLRIQIKRYPGERYDFTNDSLLNFILEKNKHYGSMEGVALVILLQPTSTTKVLFDFKDLSSKLIDKQAELKFPRIGLFFNLNNQREVLMMLYPELLQTSQKLEFYSERFQNMQRQG